MMTSDKHVRALDRVAEMIDTSGFDVGQSDIVVNVQGDEPMMRPDMIAATIQPFHDDSTVDGVVLSLPIITEEQFYDPNTLKIINNIKGDILYTSRAPIPYCKEWSTDTKAQESLAYSDFDGVFAEVHCNAPESPLELVEACDSNRLYDNGYTQRVALYPYVDSLCC